MPDTGLGNRLSKILSFAGIAEALGRQVVTFWPTPGNTAYKKHMGRRFYGTLDELRALVHLPRAVRWVEDWPADSRKDGSGITCSNMPLSSADRIPTGSLLRGQLDFGWGHPTGTWLYWQYWGRRNMWPTPCVDRPKFFASMHDVYAQVRPRVDLENPASRTYLVLHWRRGDRGSVERVDPAMFNRTWVCIEGIVARISLPWLVVAEDPKDVPAVEENLRRHGAEVMPPRAIAGLANVTDMKFSLRPIVRDFFAIAGSAGLLFAGNSFANWIDSSFSSMAALVGDVPMLFPRDTTSGGNIATMQALGNKSGDPLHSYFFADQLDTFLVEVTQARLRPFVTNGTALWNPSPRLLRRAEHAHGAGCAGQSYAPDAHGIPMPTAYPRGSGVADADLLVASEADMAVAEHEALHALDQEFRVKRALLHASFEQRRGALRATNVSTAPSKA